MFKVILSRTFFVISLALLPCSTTADELKKLSISFFGKQIGYIKLREINTADSQVIYVNGEILASPFRLFNGKFDYKAVINGLSSSSSSIHFESTLDTTFKERKITYLVKNDNLIAVDILPKKEQTKFTNPKQIDFEFVDPASSIIKLLNSPCKNSFIIYDGRRVIEIVAMIPASKFECRYRYEIINGPAHLYPFNFKIFEILTYFNSEESLETRTMIVKAGSLKLILEEISLVN